MNIYFINTFEVETNFQVCNVHMINVDLINNTYVHI